MTHEKSYRFAADVGGTFTDLVLHDDATGSLLSGKVLTTHDDPSAAILQGVSRLVEQSRLTFAQMRYFAHATTLVTNTVIERNGARTGLLTTAGFCDVIEMGTETRYDIYDLGIELPAPLVPPELRREAIERIDASGNVVTPLDLESARTAVAELLELGAEAIAVCFLHSYLRADHEEAVGAMIEREFPSLTVSLSCRVQPEIREYERLSTTVGNAYTQPKTRSYLARLQQGLDGRGFTGQLNVMLSSGGLTAARIASGLPIKILESGPAAGVEAARALGLSIGVETLASFDMGGTTAKIGLVEDGAISLSSQLEVARLQRFKKGSGLLIKSTTVDLIEIGAGGGSIARVDQYGLLKVGPESASSTPGPACYARGGERPTVTDSDLLLGYLDPDDFAGGDITLDRERAAAAVARLAERLQRSVTDIAWGIHEIANENMATAARVHLVERGKDPSAFTFVAFGGAGPTHAQGVAARLGARRVIVPRNAGVMSAVGLLAAPMSFDAVRSQTGALDEVEWPAVRARLDEIGHEASAQLSGIAPAQIEIAFSADMRYRGQGREISVALPAATLAGGAAAVHDAFVAAYSRLYGRGFDEGKIEFVSLRARASSVSDRFAFLRIGQSSGAPKVSSVRQAFFREHGFVETRIYRHADLGGGHAFDGPAIVQSAEFAALVGPGQSCSVDAYGNLIIDL